MNLTHEALQTLIAKGAFELYGQPKWTFGKNTCNTYEVFAEVLHLPDGQSVPCHDYIRQITANAQTAGMFSDWFLKESLAMMRRLIDHGGSNLITAVDAWASSINDPQFVEKVETALAESCLAPKNLEFELTDIDSLTSVGIENLNVLKEKGVSLLMDNFGIGNNNVFALTKLPFDGIKLAKCFATGLPADEKLVRILVSIAHMADTLGITVCAKGVETGDQLEFFDNLGFYKGQGYMIGQPLPEKELCHYIQQFAKKKA